jgi:hypothetical protein
LLDLPADQWPGSLSDRGPQTGTGSQSTHQYFKKLGLAPRSVFSRPRTPNHTLRARIEAHFGTIESQPVYPGFFADVPTAVTYFTGFQSGATTGAPCQP